MTSLEINKIAASAAIIFALGSPAYAADLGGHRVSTKDAPVESVPGTAVKWTGFWVGAEGGYMNANHEVKADGSEGDDSFNLLDLDGLNSRGFLGGGSGGFDWQMGNWVAGAQVFYHFSNADTTLSVNDGNDKASLDKDEEWGGTVRLGRLLGADQRVLAYGLAGWQQANYSLHFDGADDVDGLKTKQTYSGPVAGAGVEYALNSYIFVGGEYTHFFGGKKTWFSESEDGGSIKVTDDLDEDRIMATLKIKLGSNLLGN